ncbi:MAG TPA: shikimate dehydrogenase [Vicinamibacterales bacterium]|nr:shikimate dehydrogenase [Vicinamibacterales bacterium]
MPKPLLCVTVTAETTAELRARRDAVADADLIELRLDTVRDPDPAAALAGRRRPVILTCRPTWEGGFFAGSEEERKRILADALRLGAEYVDLEWRARFDDLLADSRGRRIVLSSHDFTGVPDDLRAMDEAMRATGAEVVKIAATMNRLSDCIPLLELAAGRNSSGGGILIGMGPYGALTRVLAGRFGSAWTYAGAIEAIGQIDAESLLEDFQFRSLTDSTAVYGIAGGSVGHSVSPWIHNAAFRASGVDAVYVPMPAVSADDFLGVARAIGIKGASVTIPFKVAVFDAMDHVEPVARCIGAINTIRVDGSRWIGTNTDANGFLQPLRQRVALDGLRVAVLGAGGAARAVVVALGSTRCSIRLHARNRARAEELAALAPLDLGPWPPQPGSWDVLVNCTPIGMYPRVEESPLAAGQLTGQFVYDLIYNPPATRLLRDAKAVGCETIGGLEMLVAQAREQFEWWTGMKPRTDVMTAAAEKRLAEFTRDENHFV